MTDRRLPDRARGVIGVIGVMVAAVLFGGCGRDSQPANAPAGAVGIEVRADPDSPDTGGSVPVPGLWLIAVPQEARPAEGERTDVAALRAAGAELVRTDARGRATLRRAQGAVLLCALGSSDNPSRVAVLQSGTELPVNTGQSYRLTFGEAGLRFVP